MIYCKNILQHLKKIADINNIFSIAYFKHLELTRNNILTITQIKLIYKEAEIF